jgi:hypothetical protein
MSPAKPLLPFCAIYSIPWAELYLILSKYGYFTAMLNAFIFKYPLILAMFLHRKPTNA